MFTNDYYKQLCQAFVLVLDNFLTSPKTYFCMLFSKLVTSLIVPLPHLPYSDGLDHVYYPSVHVYIVTVVLFYAFSWCFADLKGYKHLKSLKRFLKR